MNSCEAVEHTLHLIDMRDIHADIVVPTPLAVKQPKPASRVVVARTGAAQVDHRSQLVRSRRRWWRAFRSASPVKKVIITVALVLTLSLAINWIYQVIRKPSELFFPVSGTLYKTPPETWRQYAPIFRKYATNVITPDLLAAIAQVEASGNPVVRRSRANSQPFFCNFSA
jgi:hypothetical protein